MRYIGEDQRRAIFANLKDKVMRPSFAKTVTIQPGAPYPYSSEEVQKRREQEKWLNADQRGSRADSIFENVTEAGIGAAVGGLTGAMLSRPESGFLKTVALPTGIATVVNPLLGVGTGVATTMYNYPYALPGALIGGLMFPMVFAKKPNQFALYGGKTIEQHRVEEEQKSAQPQVIVIQQPVESTVPTVSRRRSGSGAQYGANIGGATGATIGVGLASIAGKVPPLTFIPEEFVTVPLFGGVGYLAGSVLGGAAGSAILE